MTHKQAMANLQKKNRDNDTSFFTEYAIDLLEGMESSGAYDGEMIDGETLSDAVDGRDLLKAIGNACFDVGDEYARLRATK